MNHHTVLHLVEDVTNNGPLWNSSLFTFEGWNGDITDYFHGTQNIPSQVHNFGNIQFIYIALFCLSHIARKF